MRVLNTVALLALAAVALYCFPVALAEDDGFPTAKDRALMQWFKDGGGELHQVVYSLVGVDDEDDEETVAAARRGLFAKEAVAEGAAVASLPAALVLSLHRSAMPHKRRLDSLAQKKPECALAAALLWEKNAADSAWAPYIATLPIGHSSVAFMRSAAARSVLENSHAAHHLGKYWANEARCFGELEAALFRSAPADFPATTFDPAGVTWALATVRARSFALPRRDGEPELALLPLAELLPRGAARPLACAGAGASWRPASGGAPAAVVVRACDAKRGEEAALPRGGLSDADALARRGGLPPGSADAPPGDDDKLPIRLPAVLNTEDDAAARRARAAAMKKCRKGGDARAYTRAGATQQLLCAARTAQVPVSAFSAATPAPDLLWAADLPTEAAVHDALIETAEDLLEGFATSPDEDRAALARIRARGGGEGACAHDDEVACRREAIAAVLREKLLLLAARDALADARDKLPHPKKAQPADKKERKAPRVPPKPAPDDEL